MDGAVRSPEAHPRCCQLDCIPVVVLIFERNPRSRRLLLSAFGDLGPEENGRRLPVELHEMPKSAGEPGLEVADFIANTVAGHARSHLVERRSGFRKDFQQSFKALT
jgi:hypothetical protein